MTLDGPICPECGKPLSLSSRRVGSLAICPSCSRPVAIKPAAARTTAPRARTAARPESLAGARRPAATLWVVAGLDGSQSRPLSKTELDELALGGQLDGRALVKRQDWPAAKGAAELYQGLAVPCLRGASDVESPFNLGTGATPPWAVLPEPPAARVPTAVRPISRGRWLKIALLVAAAFLGLLAFHFALGGPMLQPALSRRLLFWLFVLYGLGLLSFAAALFDWHWRTEEGEPRGLRRFIGAVAARYAVGGLGVAVMVGIAWLVWE